MARVQIELTGLGNLETRLQRLLRASGDLSPALRSIGEGLVKSTQDRFRHEIAPDGTAWAPLSATTLRRKKRNRDKILTEFGHLRRLIAVGAVTPQSVEIGSSLVYATTHQFGAAKGEFGTDRGGRPIPWGDIPARPFLGVSRADERDITDEIVDFLRERR